MTANFGFLARSLLLTELPGAAVDVPGGVLVVSASNAWLGLWDLAAAEDPEQLIKAAQAAATERGLTLSGVVILTEAATHPNLEGLTDALYVYGFPQASGPDSVMVLGSAPHPKPRGLTFGTTAFDELPASARESAAELTGPAGGAVVPEIHVAMQGAQSVGYVGTSSVGLVRRIVLLHVPDGSESGDTAQALVEHVAQAAQAAGQFIVCAWARRNGLARFTLTACGFAEQVTVRHFVAE
jgi:hypothetical protein